MLWLKRATNAGWRIGDVAGQSVEALQDLLGEATGGLHDSAVTVPESDTGASYLSRCLEAIEAMNPWQLENLLSSAAVAMSLPKLLDELVGPLLTRIGELWHQGEFRVGQEHMATSVIRGFLDKLRDSAGMHAEGPAILVTTPSGQNHEMGALMASVAAATAGWKTVYLTPNLPSQDIVAAAINIQARAVALSLTYPEADPRTAESLRFLGNQLPEGVALIVGGRAAGSYSATLEEIGAIHLTGFGSILDVLDQLRSDSHRP